MASFLVALVGALVGFIGVVAGVVVTGRREEKKWFREQKLKGMVDFVTAVVEYYEHNIGGTVRDGPAAAKLIETMQAGRTIINLLCRFEVVNLADQLARMAIQATPQNSDPESERQFYGTLRSFTKEARAELARRAPRRLGVATPESELTSQVWPTP